MGEIAKIKFSVSNAGTMVSFDSAEFASRVGRAQAWITTQVAADCHQFVPFRQGTLRQQVWYPKGPAAGIIEWNTPYAHRMYDGKDENGRSFHYWTPGTGDHWFDAAQEAYGQSWQRGIEKIMRG